jgi:hypothetical protein
VPIAPVQRNLAAAATRLSVPCAGLQQDAGECRQRALVEMFHVRVANVPAVLLDAVAELGAQDLAMTWDLLFEAMHAALMARERVCGTTFGLAGGSC